MPSRANDYSSLAVPEVRSDGLQLDEHRSFQERSWTAERVAWAVFAVVAVLALLGFTGADGPAARTTAANPGAVVDYPRIARWDAPDTIAVTFAPGAGRREIALSADFVRKFETEQVFPPPASSFFRQGALVLRYETGASAAATVTLFVRPRAPGIASFDLTVDGQSSMTLRTFVLP